MAGIMSELTNVLLQRVGTIPKMKQIPVQWMDRKVESDV